MSSLGYSCKSCDRGYEFIHFRSKITSSPVAKVGHLVLVYKVFFLTVSKSIFNADSKSEGSQTKYVQRFSKNR